MFSLDSLPPSVPLSLPGPKSGTVSTCSGRDLPSTLPVPGWGRVVYWDESSSGSSGPVTTAERVTGRGGLVDITET